MPKMFSRFLTVWFWFRAQDGTEKSISVVSGLDDPLPGWMDAPEVLGMEEEGVRSELALVPAGRNRQEISSLQIPYRLPSVNAAYWQETGDGLSSIGLTDWLHALRDKLRQQDVDANEDVPSPLAVDENTQGDDNTEDILDRVDEEPWEPTDGVNVNDPDMVEDGEVTELLS